MANSFSLSSGVLGSAAHVVGFRGSEGLSRPYVFDVYVVIPHAHEIELRDVVSSKATLSWNATGLDTLDLGDAIGEPYRYHGVIAGFRLLRSTSDVSLYEVKLVPQLWQLGLSRHSRIWTHKSFVDVIKEVLEESGFDASDYEFRPAPNARPEEHICQYKESNLAFVHRWLEREGYYYFFEQDGNREKLIITNSKAVHAPLHPVPIRYNPGAADVAAGGRNFDNFSCAHAALPASVRLNDYDYAQPNLSLVSTAPVSNGGLGEVADYGHRFFTPGDAKRLAKIRSEEFLSREVIFHATGAAMHLGAGFTFSLVGHPRATFDTEYLVTELQHQGRDSVSAEAWGTLVPALAQDTYRVEVTAIEASTQYRHGMTTAWPRVDGYEIGVVDSMASSPYAPIDDQGRYAIKLKFDEGTMARGKASTWVRMMQPHGGSAEGHHFPLRQGTEVIVTFMGGDPDRPLIAGAVHNAATPSMVTASNYTQNVIQTGGGNRVEMEDVGGAQYIDIYSPTQGTTIRMGSPVGPYNFYAHTGGNGGIDIDGFYDVDVVGDATHHVSSGNNTITVDSGYMQTTISSGYYQIDVNSFAKVNSASYVEIHANGGHGRFDSQGPMTIESTASTLTGKAPGHVHLESTGSTAHIKASGNVTVESSGGDFIQNIGGKLIKNITGDEITTITANRTFHISGDTTINNSGDSINNISGSTTNTISGHVTNTITGNAVTSVNANSETTTHGNTKATQVGFKEDYALAGAVTVFIGAKAELTIAAKLEVEASVKFGINGAIDGRVKVFNFEQIGTKIQNRTAAILNSAIAMHTGGLHLFL